MKKIISILIVILSVSHVFAQTTPKKVQLYGAGGEITGIGGNGFAFSGTLEYKFLTAKELISQSHVIGGNLLVGARFDDGVHLLVGGGYDQNITYERGQPYGMVKFNTPIVMVSGKLLFSQQKNYNNNYEVALSIFPGQNVAGIGVFYLTEYDCNVIGAKLTFRFGKTNGSSGKKRDDCSICGL